MLEVSCALIMVDNKVLICQRPPEKANGLKWEFPGGKLKPGETGLASIKREIKEELDIDIEPLKELKSITLHLKIKLMPFICNGYQGTIKTLAHIQHKFITIETLFTYNLTPADKALCKYLNEHPSAILFK